MAEIEQGRVWVAWGKKMSIIRGSQLHGKVRPTHPRLQPCCQSLALPSFSLEHLVSDCFFAVVALQSAHKRLRYEALQCCGVCSRHKNLIAVVAYLLVIWSRP